MTFTRRKFNRKSRGGKKKTIRRKRKTRRKRRGGATQKQSAAWAEKANKVMAIDDEETRSLKVGGSLTLTTSMVIFAEADDPSTLTVYVKESDPK